MISGFRTIKSILDFETQSIFTQWPNWQDFENNNVPIEDDKVELIKEKIFSKRTFLLYGAQAHRKTITAKTIGYLLSKIGWAVWYSEIEYLNIHGAFNDMKAFDKKKCLFVIDDCHKDSDATEWLLTQINSLKKVSLFLVSRPLAPIHLSKPDSAFANLYKANSIELTVNNNLIRKIVLSDLNNKIPSELQSSYLSLISDEEIEELIKFIGSDLEMLNWLLKSWNPESGQKLTDVVNNKYVYSFVISKRLYTNEIRKCLLPLAAIYQFDVPVQSKYFPSIIDTLVSNGTAILVPPKPDSQGIFVKLSHPSLARIYIEAAEVNDLLESYSAVEYTYSRILEYLLNKPINCFGLFRGLALSGRSDIIKQLCSDKRIIDLLSWIAIHRDTTLYKLSKLLRTIELENKELSKRLWDSFVVEKGRIAIFNELMQLDIRQIQILIKCFELVDSRLIMSLFSIMISETSIKKAISIDLNKLTSILKIIQSMLRLTNTEIRILFEERGTKLICSDFEKGLSLTHARYIIRILKDSSVIDVGKLLSSLKLETFFKNRTKIQWPQIIWLFKVCSVYCVEEPVEKTIKLFGEKEFCEQLKIEHPYCSYLILIFLKRINNKIFENILNKIGVNWLVKNYNANALAELLKLIEDIKIKSNILLLFDEIVLENIKKISSDVSFLRFLEVIKNINDEIKPK
jgi:hypothetical protein